MFMKLYSWIYTLIYIYVYMNIRIILQKYSISDDKCQFFSHDDEGIYIYMHVYIGIHTHE
jgi:hypothetical protein